MKLDDNQLKQVATWFAAGESLSEIQKRISADFGVSCTYLDVRLLVADLPQPAEPEPEPAPAPREEIAPPAEEDLPEMTPVEDLPEAPAEEAELPPADLPPAEEALGEVTVDMDAIVIPGAMASGTVTFSDGQSGKWYLDQMGRMGISGFGQGYRPSPADSAAFQKKLMELFRAKGMIP